MWDHEVDVLCVGGVVGACASAVVAADAGADVLIASPTAGQRGWPVDQVADPETRAYFAALIDGLATEPLPGADVPVRPVRPLTGAERRKVAPFYGDRLTKWTEHCLRSPYGLMHTRASDWGTTTMRTLDERSIEVKTVGTMALPATGGPVPLATWLAAQTRMRDVDTEPDASLQRFVFDEGVVVGAVLDTVRGPYAVRARHGITLAPRGVYSVEDHLPGEDEAEVALVSELGSRFARVELLAAAPSAPAPSAPCRNGDNRPPRRASRVSRRNRSEPRRSREVNGHPPFGQ